MASIARFQPFKKAPLDSIFSQPCLFSRTSSRCALASRSRLTVVTSSRGIGRTFTISAAFREKKYTKDHEWIELSPDGKIGTIGISTYAAKALGDVVFIELPTLDSEYKARDTIGAVESVKSASDILAPRAGKVVAKNDLLEEKPGVINKAPESEGWIAKIEVVQDEEVEGLMDADEYRKLTEE